MEPPLRTSLMRQRIFAFSRQLVDSTSVEDERMISIEFFYKSSLLVQSGLACASKHHPPSTLKPTSLPGVFTQRTNHSIPTAGDWLVHSTSASIEWHFLPLLRERGVVQHMQSKRQQQIMHGGRSNAEHHTQSIEQHRENENDNWICFFALKS